jgi:hypothetical protein
VIQFEAGVSACGRYGWFAVFVAVCSYSLAAGCSRDVDLVDTPDAGSASVATGFGPDAGDIPLVRDAGLNAEDSELCAERPSGNCVGSNDFPCALERWTPELIDECQAETGCITNGWLAIEMNDDGCAKKLRMTDPNSEFVACLVEKLDRARCPCSGATQKEFLGEGNSGCGVDGSLR